MKTAITGLLLWLTFSLEANAVTYKREEGSCFPLNNISFGVGNKSFGGLSETDYNQILDKVQIIMGPEIKKRLSKNLIIDRRWAEPTVDAFATRDDTNNAVIVMNGGLARHPQMTKDGFLLLVCHELGHHLGGAPKILRGNSGLRGWSSAEGQADYYATSKCLPLFFQAGVENKNFDYDIDANNLKLALSKCRDNICARIVLAGLAVSQVFASLINGTPAPSLITIDPTRVDKTIYNHPNPQCRLDTYLSGANCDAGIEIPFDLNDPKIGACVKDQGSRPMCWFQEKDFTSN
jgi:hypothetical protein